MIFEYFFNNSLNTCTGNYIFEFSHKPKIASRCKRVVKTLLPFKTYEQILPESLMVRIKMTTNDWYFYWYFY